MNTVKLARTSITEVGPNTRTGSARRRRTDIRASISAKATRDEALAACGGGGNRTRVLQRFNESSPSAVTLRVVELQAGSDPRSNNRIRLRVPWITPAMTKGKPLK